MPEQGRSPCPLTQSGAGAFLVFGLRLAANQADPAPEQRHETLARTLQQPQAGQMGMDEARLLYGEARVSQQCLQSGHGLVVHVAWVRLQEDVIVLEHLDEVAAAGGPHDESAPGLEHSERLLGYSRGIVRVQVLEQIGGHDQIELRRAETGRTGIADPKAHVVKVGSGQVGVALGHGPFGEVDAYDFLRERPKSARNRPPAAPKVQHAIAGAGRVQRQYASNSVALKAAVEIAKMGRARKVLGFVVVGPADSPAGRVFAVFPGWPPGAPRRCCGRWLLYQEDLRTPGIRPCSDISLNAILDRPNLPMNPRGRPVI